MVRMVIGAILLALAALTVIAPAVRVLLGKLDPAGIPFEASAIMLVIYGGGGGALFLWGRQAVRSKRRFSELAAAFDDAPTASDACPSIADDSSQPHQSCEPSSIAYGVPLAVDEEVVVRLIPEDSGELYSHRGQIAAVTDRRLLFLLPQRAGVSKNLDDYYVVKSIPHEQVTEVFHHKTIAMGGMLAGIILMALAGFLAWGGITGEIIGPGVIFIPLVAAPAGITLALGLRRRVLVFSTPYGDLHWRSGPLELRKTRLMIAQLRDFFEARQMPVHDMKRALKY